MQRQNDGQTTMFPTGEQLKREGIALVSEHTPNTWKVAFRDWVMELPVGTVFTSEDVTRVVGQPPNHPNAVGAQINALARRGEIVLQGYVKAKRNNQHATRIGLWKRE